MQISHLPFPGKAARYSIGQQHFDTGVSARVRGVSRNPVSWVGTTTGVAPASRITRGKRPRPEPAGPPRRRDRAARRRTGERLLGAVGGDDPCRVAGATPAGVQPRAMTSHRVVTPATRGRAGVSGRSRLSGAVYGLLVGGEVRFADGEVVAVGAVGRQGVGAGVPGRGTGGGQERGAAAKHRACFATVARVGRRHRPTGRAHEQGNGEGAQNRRITLSKGP